MQDMIPERRVLRSSAAKIPPAEVATRVGGPQTATLGLMGAGDDSDNSDESNGIALAAHGASLGDFAEGTVSLDRICKHESYRRFYFDLLQRCDLQESSNCKSESINTC